MQGRHSNEKPDYGAGVGKRSRALAKKANLKCSRCGTRKGWGSLLCATSAAAPARTRILTASRREGLSHIVCPAHTAPGSNRPAHEAMRSHTETIRFRLWLPGWHGRTHRRPRPNGRRLPGLPARTTAHQRSAGRAGDGDQSERSPGRPNAKRSAPHDIAHHRRLQRLLEGIIGDPPQHIDVAPPIGLTGRERTSETTLGASTTSKKERR